MVGMKSFHSSLRSPEPSSLPPSPPVPPSYRHNAVEGPATLLLVSRRSCLRQGRRFMRRGIDAEGNVANFVETEQVSRQLRALMYHI